MSARQIKTLLVANRGEIALRVMKTARRMGLETVAVYSEADAGAPHVQFADKAIEIGPAPVGESYLNQEALLEAIKASGADAVHPGYGFLSENADFAKAVEDAGAIFVGPPEGAIDVMGDKARSKRAMIEAGVPCIPGYEGEEQSDSHFETAAKAIGFPVMVKASAGGGGRGMRMVHKAEDLNSALKLARSEAENAFGSGDLILEKAILQPRHVEIQVFGDAHGNIIHLGERDCSVQRRHQKVLEEAPCPVMTPDLREAMGNAAVEAAQAVDYVGAGTVEFLLDADRNFYFLEMNTRLQVEHPVTEMVTGLDLVELQIRVARGEALPLAQDQVELCGHAIEARIYAEDPGADFLPSTGPVHQWVAPSGDGIRVDAGIQTGSEVSPFYDAMVAKLIAYGRNREEALTRLSRALEQTAFFGPDNNIDFLADAVSQDAFAKGEATTAFVGETYGDAGFETAIASDDDLAIASVIEHVTARSASHALALNIPDELLDWSSTAPRPSMAVFERGDELLSLRVTPHSANHYQVSGPEIDLEIEVSDTSPHGFSATLDGLPVNYRYHLGSDGLIFLQQGAVSYRLTNKVRQRAGSEDEMGGGRVAAPMHGRLLEIAVNAGDRVKAGDRLAVLEAMKMQHEITAEIDGTVAGIHAEAGTQIGADDLILEITPEAGDET